MVCSCCFLPRGNTANGLRSMSRCHGRNLTSVRVAAGRARLRRALINYPTTECLNTSEDGAEDSRARQSLALPDWFMSAEDAALLRAVVQLRAGEMARVACHAI